MNQSATSSKPIPKYVNDYITMSFENWYRKLLENGIDNEKALNLAYYISIQDAFESAYGRDRKAIEYNNHGGMMYKGEPVKYDTYEDYLNAKMGDIKRKYTALLDREINSMADFYSAIMANPDYPYAPVSENPHYQQRLEGMKSAQRAGEARIAYYRENPMQISLPEQEVVPEEAPVVNPMAAPYNVPFIDNNSFLYPIKRAAGGPVNSSQQATHEENPESNETYYGGVLPTIKITAKRPAYMNALTDYDLYRANSAFYKNNLQRRAAFLRDVGTARMNGQSDFMRDVNKLAVIPNAAVGTVGAIPLVSAAAAAMLNPVVDAALTVHGIANAPKNIRNGISEIKAGNKGRGLFDLALTGLDVAGAGQLFGRIGRMMSKNYRAKHAYNSVAPVSYADPIKRGKTWLRDMWYNEPIDYADPKWYRELRRQNKEVDPNYGYTQTGEYITTGTDFAGEIADKARIDAWAIYNGLPQQYGTYIKNADGSYSYDLNRIYELSEHTWRPEFSPDDIPFLESPAWDFVTGAGGFINQTAFKDIAKGTRSTNGVMHIEDVWNLHPFSRKKDLLKTKLSAKNKEALSNRRAKVQKIRRYMYDKDLFENGKYSKLNKFLIKDRKDGTDLLYRLNSKLINSKLVENLSDKLSRFEVGSLTGGKPFKMSTNIPYHRIGPKASNEHTPIYVYDLDPLNYSDLTMFIN